MRLLLISHAAPGADGELTPAARARAAEIGRLLPRPRAAFSSPAPCALQTAEALGLSVTAVAALGDARPGEAIADLVARAAGWLRPHAPEQGTRAAVTHAAVVRAAVVVALGAPHDAVSSVDVAPCSVTELAFREDRWRLVRANWEPALLHIPQRRGRRRAKGSA